MPGCLAGILAEISCWESLPGLNEIAPPGCVKYSYRQYIAQLPVSSELAFTGMRDIDLLVFAWDGANL
jgi:hypothetical protein